MSEWRHAERRRARGQAYRRRTVAEWLERRDAPLAPLSVTLETLPTVLRFGPYRLFFYSADRDEPPHVHVEREDSVAKLWLDPVRLEWSRGFARSEIRRLESLVVENAAFLY